MKAIFVILLMLLLPCAGHANQKPAIPRTLGDAFFLGMTKDYFIKKYHIEPTRCASCYHGELLAQTILDVTPNVRRDLGFLGLSLGSPRQQVDLFFEHGKLVTIHLEGLNAVDAIEVIGRKFGECHTVQKTTEVAEFEWKDARTLLRLTRWGSEYQLTLSNNKPGQTTDN